VQTPRVVLLLFQLTLTLTLPRSPGLLFHRPRVSSRVRERERKKEKTCSTAEDAVFDGFRRGLLENEGRADRLSRLWLQPSGARLCQILSGLNRAKMKSGLVLITNRHFESNCGA
jgi:hypothetical protein